jgi:hypothetical protein
MVSTTMAKEWVAPECGSRNAHQLEYERPQKRNPDENN